MSNEVVLDIETQDAASGDNRSLRISVVGCYFFENNEYLCYEEHELPQLFRRLEHSGRIIGYNTKSFDYPIMNNYYAGDVASFTSLDILEEIHKTLGFRVKLDDVAKATLGVGKSGHGLQAVEWWKQGEIQKIKDYCLQDVKITKEVYEFGKLYHIVRYLDRLGTYHDIPVNFGGVPKQDTTINLTMGF
ncbi:MAG: ribonuclease H-like domain-containing protein [Patescibacteria group bacterium]